jgi:putative restriction endonuclease
LQRERSRSLVKRFKALLTDFSCAVCHFNFERAYGAIGEKFIEAHHIKPVSQMKAGDRTRIEDLVPLCSNCHRMVHKMSPAMSVEGLREMAVERLSVR